MEENLGFKTSSTGAKKWHVLEVDADKGRNEASTPPVADTPATSNDSMVAGEDSAATGTVECNKNDNSTLLSIAQQLGQPSSPNQRRHLMEQLSGSSEAVVETIEEENDEMDSYDSTDEDNAEEDPLGLFKDG